MILLCISVLINDIENIFLCLSVFSLFRVCFFYLVNFYLSMLCWAIYLLVELQGYFIFSEKQFFLLNVSYTTNSTVWDLTFS